MSCVAEEKMEGNLEDVFKKWEKRSTSGRYSGAAAQNGVNHQLQSEQGRQAWRDKFGDSVRQPDRQASRAKRRSRQKVKHLGFFICYFLHRETQMQCVCQQ